MLQVSSLEERRHNSVIWMDFDLQNPSLSSRDALPCAWFPSSSPSVVSQSLSHHILESFNQNAYYCWKGLWGSLWHVAGSVCWDRGRGLWASSALCVGHASCTLSGWPALPFTFCLPPVATSWQLTCTHDQLWGTLRPGLMDALLGWGWCWQPVKADFGGQLAVPELSDQFGERFSQTAAHPFAASSVGLWRVGLGCLQANEQQLSVLKLDYTVCSRNNELSCLRLSWNDEMCFFFWVVNRPKNKQVNQCHPQICPQTCSKRYRRHQSAASLAACYDRREMFTLGLLSCFDICYWQQTLKCCSYGELILAWGGQMSE